MDSAPSSFVQYNGDIDSSPLDLTGFTVNGDATPTGPTMSTTPGSSQQIIIEEKMEDSHSTIQLAGLSEEQSPDHHPPTVQGSSQSGVSDISRMSALPGEFEVTGDGQTSITDLLLILWPSLRPEMQFQETLDLIHELGGNTVPTEADLSLYHPSSLVEPQIENGGEVEDIVPYEVILAFEETVGTSRSRLTQESISAGVEQRKHQPIELGSSAEDVMCCICLESYADGNVLGKIKCGHDYHFSCIEKWLLRENKCPLCKRTAVPEAASST